MSLRIAAGAVALSVSVTGALITMPEASSAPARPALTDGGK